MDRLRGATSGLSIFEKAIAGSHDCDDALRAPALEDKSAQQMYDALTVEDMQRVADFLHPVDDRLHGKDGFVSLEVPPRLAHDAAGTIANARRLWVAVDRPNAMIKVPETSEGLLAIEQLIGESTNVNLSLLFGLRRYQQVAEAYLAGLENLPHLGKPLESAASVASLFLSRIEVLLAPTLEKLMPTDQSKAKIAMRFHGRVAHFSAIATYQMSRDMFAGERVGKLTSQSADSTPPMSQHQHQNPRIQRSEIRGGSHRARNNQHDPLETLVTYREHGTPTARLTSDTVQASETLLRLGEGGTDLDMATRRHEDEGVQMFIKAFDVLVNTLKEKRSQMQNRPKIEQTGK